MLCAASCLLASAKVLAQGESLGTADQAEMLMSLPEGERERALRSLGLDSSGTPSASDVVTSAARTPANALLRRNASSNDLATSGTTIEGNSTIIVRFVLKEEIAESNVELSTGTGRTLLTFPYNLEGMRTYELDRDGVLNLRDLLFVPLAGLDESQAASRIMSEPSLDVFDIYVALLPLEPVGVDGLALFGRDFFSNAGDLFADPATTPVPGDYVIGPGDGLSVTLYGAETDQLTFTVDPEGFIVLPRLGPLNVAGMTLDQLRAETDSIVAEQMIGVNASLKLIRLRAIQVFVLGDVEGPGAYTVDSLTTITNALLLSGGIQENGSLRNVQLKRDGKLVRTLDLYDLLLRGDSRNDVRLRNGDVVFVPPIGRTAAVEGMVNRPARYELRSEKTVEQLVRLAGGLKAEASRSTARLQRINKDGRRTVLDIDLTSSADLALLLRDGDALRINPVLEGAAGVVTLVGHVFSPGTYQYRPGMRLTDLLPDRSVLKPLADTRYVLVRRQSTDGRFLVLTPDLSAAFLQPGGVHDPGLQARDEVRVFQLGLDRSGAINPLLQALADQSVAGEPHPIVVVSGATVLPGAYPFSDGMRVSDLLRASGGLSEFAYTLRAELAREVNVGGERLRTKFIELDLQRMMAGDKDADLLLERRDYVTIKPLPEARERALVELVGEVRFPGIYPLARGETLVSVIERAGGLTDMAFADGSIFTRVDLKDRERKRMRELAQRLEVDLAAAAVRTAREDRASGTAEGALQVGQQLLTELRETEPVGRLVIDLDQVLDSGKGSTDDIVMRPGDTLHVPPVTQEVTVIGEVQSPTSHLHAPGLTREDYIALSGGMTQDADRKHVYVVRANGTVVGRTGKSSRWYNRRDAVEIKAGDTIVVPLDADRLRPLALWTTVSTVLYQIGISVAAITAITRR
jgi:polysaccharide export outer membrane protein